MYGYGHGELEGCDAIENCNDGVDSAHSAQQSAVRVFLLKCEVLGKKDDAEYRAYVIGQAMTFSSPENDGFYYGAVQSQLEKAGLVYLVRDLRAKYVDI